MIKTKQKNTPTNYNNNAIQNVMQLSKVNHHNLRQYDNNPEKIKTLYGSNDIVKDVKELYKQEFEENHNSIEDLRKRVKLQNEEINDLRYYLNNKDNEISSLKSIIKDLKDSLDYWKDKFQRVVKFIHDKIHGIFGDKDDKYKEMADNLFINGIMDEKEYTSVINKKDKNRDDFER